MIVALFHVTTGGNQKVNSRVGLFLGLGFVFLLLLLV